MNEKETFGEQRLTAPAAMRQPAAPAIDGDNDKKRKEVTFFFFSFLRKKQKQTKNRENNKNEPRSGREI